MEQYADRLYKSTSIFTAETLQVTSGAVAVKGEKILAVGPVDKLQKYVNDSTEIVECGDSTILPGFHDSHVHFILGAIQNDEDLGFDLSDCKSMKECVDRAKKFADAHPDNPWVYGKGWNENAWEEGCMPDRKYLDEVIPDRPVYMCSWDLHSGWVNKKALEIMGWNKDTKDLENGWLIHYEDGELSGLVREPGFCEPLNNIALNCPDIHATVKKAIKEANKCGVTSLGNVHPYGNISEEETIKIFKDLEDNGDLTLRLHLFMELKKDLSGIKETEKKLTSDMLHVSGLKLITDGVCESHTGYLLEPYADQPESRGELQISKEELTEMLKIADAAGYSVRLHCIGNGAVRNALDAFEDVQKVNGRKGLRHAIEHIESCSPEDIPRFAQLGIMISMQPMHTTAAIDYYETLLGEKWKPYFWPIKSLMDAGAILTCGTDYPVVGIKPMETVYAAITRQDFDGNPENGFIPEQKISLAEVLQGFTYGSALVANYEKKIGTLTSGKYADMVIMDRDLFNSTPQEILHSEVMETLVGGKVVYEA